MASPAWFWAKKLFSFKQLHYTVLKMIMAGEADMAMTVSAPLGGYRSLKLMKRNHSCAYKQTTNSQYLCWFQRHKAELYLRAETQFKITDTLLDYRNLNPRWSYTITSEE